MPVARATGMGSTLDCADHSKSVCFLVRSTISCPVIVGKAVVVVVMSGPNQISFPLWTFVSFVVISCFHYKGHKGSQRNRNKGKTRTLEFARVFLRPALDYDFLFSIELDCIAALPVHDSEETVLPSAEREVGHRRSDSNVNTNVSGWSFVAESSRR